MLPLAKRHRGDIARLPVAVHHDAEQAVGQVVEDLHPVPEMECRRSIDADNRMNIAVRPDRRRVYQMLNAAMSLNRLTQSLLNRVFVRDICDYASHRNSKLGGQCFGCLQHAFAAIPQ